MGLVERRLADLARAVANLHPGSGELEALADDISGLSADDEEVAPLPPPGRYGRGLEPWVQPSGAHDAYPAGAWVTFDGGAWMSTHDGNVHEPGVSGWRPAAGEGEEYPPWQQPTGSHDAYQAGDRVTHDGTVWESDIDANVWEPPEQWTEI